MATLLAAVEATLLGKDERLVAKCDVRGILAVFERWDIYDVDTLLANLASSFAELQIDLAPVAAKSFLALLKATITRVPSAAPPDMPSSAPAARERQVQGVQGWRRRAARVQLLHRRLPQLGSVPGRGTGGQ